jgi:hypothetical protein
MQCDTIQREKLDKSSEEINTLPTGASSSDASMRLLSVLRHEKATRVILSMLLDRLSLLLILGVFAGLAVYKGDDGFLSLP